MDENIKEVLKNYAYFEMWAGFVRTHPVGA
jgi:hypothetical protein